MPSEFICESWCKFSLYMGENKSYRWNGDTSPPPHKKNKQTAQASQTQIGSWTGEGLNCLCNITNHESPWISISSCNLKECSGLAQCPIPNHLKYFLGEFLKSAVVMVVGWVLSPFQVRTKMVNRKKVGAFPSKWASISRDDPSHPLRTMETNNFATAGMG